MSAPVVIVKQGWLRGATVKTITGGSYISFKGIPFAAPPVGNLRFADPQPPQSWTGVRDSFTEGSKCAQTDIFTQQFVGDDNCLHLNVATASLTGSRPVLVFIHGGGFVLGDGGFDLTGPDYFIDSGIVYVGINYRLGILGFLNLDDEVAPGNTGLKDQVAALKWVKENIAQFGGDPNNVTIFGGSAGGASVHYLLLSPLAKGLFHKAISQSGVALSSFASTSNTVETARRYVATLGRDITDPKEIVEYLRTIPVRKLIEAQESMLTPEEKRNFLYPFRPSVDDKSAEPFIPRPLEELVAEGFEIPVIMGYTSHEGSVFLIRSQEVPYETFDENFEILVPRDLAAKAPSKVSEIAAEIRKFYFGDKRITKDSVDEFIQCIGDVGFVVGIHKVIEIQREKKSPTYFYRFSYDSPNSFLGKLLQFDVKGAAHGAETEFLFTSSLVREHVKIEPGSTADILRIKCVRMWTDFAKTGNPTPSIDDVITVKWERVTKTTKNYLKIDAEISAGVNPNEAMWETWKRIYNMVDDQ